MKLLIVDDEPLACANLALLCELKDGVNVVGEANCGAAAIDAAEKLRPDVMVLDMELPDMSGLEVLRAARRRAATLGIMVTADATHTAAPADAGVVDCLVKPIGVSRFAESLERARQRRRFGDAPPRPRVSALAPAVPGPMVPAPAVAESPAEALQGMPRVLVGEREHRMYVLKPERIEFIESHGNYVKLHAGNAEYISRDSVKRLADELAGNGFVRIERSLLVNVRSILYAQRVGRGTYAFTLTSGSCLYSGATFREDILRVLPLGRALTEAVKS